jgi:hypothetical protein
LGIKKREEYYALTKTIMVFICSSVCVVGRGEIMFKLFGNKTDLDKAKGLPIPDTKMVVTTILHLHSVRMSANLSDTKIYRAVITYMERPTNYSDHGMEKTEEFTADNWSELVDKVDKLLTEAGELPRG